MKKNLLRAILPMVFMFTIVSCSSPSKEDIAVTPELVKVYDYQPDETELADLINDHRVSLGLNPLQIVNHISFKCEEHDDYMITNNVVNHDLFDQRSENIMEVLGATKVNENIAYNFSTANSVLNAWLNSPGHKANIEGDFTHFGISIRVNTVTGKKYYTNIFMKR
jgi:uncharacterized protein YkwD